VTTPVWTSDRSVRIPAGSPAEAHALAEALRSADHGWLEDAVPSSHGLLVIIDPLLESPSVVERALARLDPSAHASPAPPREITIPACYDPSLAPDLAHVADATGLDPEELIARHAGPTYTVRCVGFSPGFAYLGGLHGSLHLPRRPEPRPRVPAGSVAIAADTTAVYPHATPGGWRLIGRTAEVMFDPARPEPSRLRAGDRVRFQPISLDEYRASAEHAEQE